MPERENDFSPETGLPDLLDIVKLDGRWAQVKLGGETVTFLDDGTEMDVDWNAYRLARPFHSLAANFLKDQFGEEIPDGELARAHWGPEEKEHPELKGQIRVFGEFVKK